MKTIEKVRKYVEDTANSVSEHVLTIAHNLNKIIEAEAKEIEDLSFQAGYVSHRLKSHQRYMSELFMTKFQTFPRPRPTIHILRQAIPGMCFFFFFFWFCHTRNCFIMFLFVFFCTRVVHVHATIFLFLVCSSLNAF